MNLLQVLNERLNLAEVHPTYSEAHRLFRTVCIVSVVDELLHITTRPLVTAHRRLRIVRSSDFSYTLPSNVVDETFRPSLTDIGTYIEQFFASESRPAIDKGPIFSVETPERKMGGNE